MVGDSLTLLSLSLELSPSPWTWRCYDCFNQHNEGEAQGISEGQAALLYLLEHSLLEHWTPCKGPALRGCGWALLAMVLWGQSFLLIIWAPRHQWAGASPPYCVLPKFLTYTVVNCVAAGHWSTCGEEVIAKDELEVTMRMVGRCSGQEQPWPRLTVRVHVCLCSNRGFAFLALDWIMSSEDNIWKWILNSEDQWVRELMWAADIRHLLWGWTTLFLPCANISSLAFSYVWQRRSPGNLFYVNAIMPQFLLKGRLWVEESKNQKNCKVNQYQETKPYVTGWRATGKLTCSQKTDVSPCIVKSQLMVTWQPKAIWISSSFMMAARLLIL